MGRSSLAGSLPAALTPRRRAWWPTALLVIGVGMALIGAIYGYRESQRSERVVIAVRPIPYGRQITPDDLGTIELPLHRPPQVRGVADVQLLVGRYATRSIAPNDLLRPDMVADRPPDVPVYPNGRALERNMVATPFDVAAVGPLTDRDTLNIGLIATDPSLCDRARAAAGDGDAPPPPPPLVLDADGAGRGGRAYACRWMSQAPILYLDGTTAYLALTPAQALALRALQAAGVALWAERYGAASDPLQFMERLDAASVTLIDLTRPASETVRLEPLHPRLQDRTVVESTAPVPGRLGTATAPAPAEDAP